MNVRAHVMEIDQDFIDGHWSVACFCGWEAESLWDDREDAVAEYHRHKAEPEIEFKCSASWGGTEACRIGVDGHTCIRTDLHEGRCRCRCGATTTHKDPIYEDDEELQEAREALDD